MRCRSKEWVDGGWSGYYNGDTQAWHGRVMWVGWLVNLHGVTWVLAFDGSEYRVTVRGRGW